MTDRRALVLRALLLREQSSEEIQQSSGAPMREIRMAVASLCGSGWIAQTSTREAPGRSPERLHRITDSGREWLAERGDA